MLFCFEKTKICGLVEGPCNSILSKSVSPERNYSTQRLHHSSSVLVFIVLLNDLFVVLDVFARDTRRRKTKTRLGFWGGFKFKTISSGWLVSLISVLKKEVWQKAKRNKRNKRRVRANAYLQLEGGVLCCSFSWCEVIKTFLSFKSDVRRILNLNSEVCAQPKTSKFSSMWKP